VLGLDDEIARLAAGHGLLVALGVAVLLGLRHATDPDHLTAVSTLVVSDGARGRWRAVRLGAAWGAGHAATIVLLGLPVVLFSDALPGGVQRAAEIAIGLVIIVLGGRLLLRWHRGRLGARERAAHGPRTAFGIGLLHGVGGSAGVSILLIGAISSDTEAIAALVLFAGATAVSMAAASAALGRVLASGPGRRSFATLAPGLAVFGVLFGAWYSLGAAGAVPYVF
jgi:hypothetical protein